MNFLYQGGVRLPFFNTCKIFFCIKKSKFVVSVFSMEKTVYSEKYNSKERYKKVKPIFVLFPNPT